MTDRIEKTVDLAAPIERVWHALSDHAEFGTWFGVDLDGPFRPGEFSRGRLTITGYEHVVWEARVVAMDRPHLFSFTWHPYAVDPAVDYAQEPSTLVEFRLEPTTSGTRLSVVESGFDKLPEHRRAEAFLRNDRGWTKQVQNIEAHVRSGA